MVGGIEQGGAGRPLQHLRHGAAHVEVDGVERHLIQHFGGFGDVAGYAAQQLDAEPGLLLPPLQDMLVFGVAMDQGPCVYQGGEHIGRPL